MPCISRHSSLLVCCSVDSGISDDPFAQQQIKNDIHYKFLDKWLFEDLDNLLKYLVVEKSGVRIVKNKQDKKKTGLSSKTKFWKFLMVFSN